MRWLCFPMLVLCFVACDQQDDERQPAAAAEPGVTTSDDDAKPPQPVASENYPVITLEPSAAAEMRAVAEREALGKHWLRVGVKRVPDGFSYILDLTENVDVDNDYFLKSGGYDIVLAKSDAEYLHGTTIRYQDNDRGRGFVFDNPNAQQQ